MSAPSESAQPRAGLGKRIVLFATVAIILLCAGSMLATQRALKKKYTFIAVDHPVDMWDDGPNRWIYYFIPSGDVTGLATSAKRELARQGFQEDDSTKPWFRFVKGQEEVIVCAHAEIEVRGTRLHPATPGKKPDRKWAVVYVKNGPGSQTPLVTFKALKLLKGW